MARISPTPRTILAFAMGACLILGAGYFWQVRGRLDRMPRVRLQVKALEGLDDPQRAGLEEFLLHQIEALGGMPVLRWSEPTGPGGASSARELFLQIGARKREALLGFEVAWSWGAEGEQKGLVLPTAAPDEAMRSLCKALPLGLASPRAGTSWPRKGAIFWDLVDSMGLTDIRSEANRSLALARSVVKEAPDCAEAQVNLGIHLYSELQWTPGRDSTQLDVAVSSFKTGLELQPGHPRGARDLAVILTDTGRAKEALDEISKALALRPGVPRLYEALAYASRTTGLLDISRRAISTQHRLALDQTRQVGETTLLYLGDWSGFLDTCVPSRRPSDTKAWFYRGYVDLARGDQEGALKAFRAAGKVKEGWYRFEDLAEVLALHLEGHTDQARERLTALDRARIGLRIPDGEFTFKQAEANVILGNLNEGMELASRAFAQGFCCVRWYECSPFLGPIRTHPRWAGLMQRVRERQAQLEGRFTAEGFGL